MTVNHFNDNINIQNIKPYCEWLRRKSPRIITNKEIETNAKKSDVYSIKNSLLNHLLLLTYLKQLDIAIIRFEENCIIIKYLQFELKLYIYPYDYDLTIRNLKFECSKYSVNEELEEYLILFLDENWDLIIDFIHNNKTNNYFNVDKAIPNSLEVTLN